MIQFTRRKGNGPLAPWYIFAQHTTNSPPITVAVCPKEDWADRVLRDLQRGEKLKQKKRREAGRR